MTVCVLLVAPSILGITELLHNSDFELKEFRPEDGGWYGNGCTADWSSDSYAGKHSVKVTNRLAKLFTEYIWRHYKRKMMCRPTCIILHFQQMVIHNFQFRNIFGNMMLRVIKQCVTDVSDALNVHGSPDCASAISTRCMTDCNRRDTNHLGNSDKWVFRTWRKIVKLGTWTFMTNTYGFLLCCSEQVMIQGWTLKRLVNEWFNNAFFYKIYM